MGICVFVADPHVGIEVSHGDSSLMTSRCAEVFDCPVVESLTERLLFFFNRTPSGAYERKAVDPSFATSSGINGSS